MMLSKKITIFEGADGSGKSTAAHKFAEQTGAKYSHYGVYPDEENIAHYYIEGMGPALLGHSDVVMDRSWFDEEPYGIAFRGGKDRIGQVGRELLKELALRCGGLVIVCRPPWEVVKANYLSRHEKEYLRTTDQLKIVYDHFTCSGRAYPMSFPYDYTKDHDLNPESLDKCRSKLQPSLTSNEIYLLLEKLIKKDYDYVIGN